MLGEDIVGEAEAVSSVASGDGGRRESLYLQSGNDVLTRTLAGFRGLTNFVDAVPQQIQHSYDTAQHFATRLSMLRERTYLVKQKVR